MNKIALIIATYFGAGLSPKAPGTAGSFATLPLAFVMAYFFGRDGILCAAVVSFFIGVWAIHQITKDSEEKDPSKVVIDETAGQLMSFVLVAPYLQGNLSIKAFVVYLLGFGLFRLFDIVKTGPVKWADTKLKNAWGVMLDDVFAGIFAAVVLMLVANRM
ncbi:MAG: phosphatidylglycerophosphatase A [Alphaproteobacteria bacterium]|nr:phosphatidylglycerophosphatase A [Alphaproteobacteria bacterium]MBQ2811148.1 phosphatidylglycerophosphatase A [Alphaproteobacteria bacterium]